MKLSKKGRYWWIDYRAGGKRYRQSTGATTYAAAKVWMEQIDIARKMPTFEAAVEVLRKFYEDAPAPGSTPVAAIWEIYERLAKTTGKQTQDPRGMIRRKNQLDRFLKWLKEKRPTIKTAEQITGPIAAGFAAHLADDGLKTKTRANILGELGTIWKMLEKASTEIKNLWANLSPKNTDGERGQAFTPDEEKRLLEAAERIGKDWHPVCVLMRHTGLRYSDVARLRWTDLDGDIIKTKPHKTAAHKISVMIPLTDAAKAAVASLDRRGDFLFPLHAELYGDRSRASREVLNFREVLDAAEITGNGYTIHSWRHTAATRLAESGADMETRKRILGHRTDEMAAHYDHAAHLEQTRAALDAAAT